MNEINYENRIRALENAINEFEYHYRILDNPIVSDEEFDKTKKELEKLSKEYPQFVSENSPLKRIGAVLTDGFNRVNHKHIMGSIENTYSHEELIDWDKKLSEKLGVKPNSIHYILEDKFDGISGSLHYEDSKLVLAATRGDGVVGDDITNNAKMVLNIPKELSVDYSGEIRGEFVIFKNQLEKINEAEDEEFKNVRNLVSGTMKSHDSNIVRNRNVIFIPYYCFDENNDEIDFDGVFGSEIFAEFWDIGLPTFQTEGGNISRIIDVLKDLENKEHHRYYKNRLWLVDGAVIKVSDFSLREKLGYVSHCPVWAKAFKYSQEKAVTKLKSITWQVGRDRISPVAELEPVELEGTTVSRATCHNITQMKRLGIVAGCMVEIEKAGFIIPYINKVVDNKIIDNIDIPETCPVCGHKTEIRQIEAEYLTCTNEMCKGKLLSKTNYFVKTLKIDCIGKSLIQKLIDANMIKTPLDLFHITYEQLISLEKMGKTNASKILKNIEKAMIQPFSKVIACLGINEVGESNSEKIAFKIKSISELMKTDFDTLASIDNVGEKTANFILEYVNKNQSYLERVDKVFVVRKDEGYSEILAGKKFVITGAAVKPREELESMVKRNGGECSSSVSKKTDYLIIGSKEDDSFNSSKKKKALELNVPIVNEFWLFEKINFTFETKCDKIDKVKDDVLNDYF